MMHNLPLGSSDTCDLDHVWKLSRLAEIATMYHILSGNCQAQLNCMGRSWNRAALYLHNNMPGFGTRLCFMFSQEWQADLHMPEAVCLLDCPDKLPGGMIAGCNQFGDHAVPFTPSQGICTPQSSMSIYSSGPGWQQMSQGPFDPYGGFLYSTYMVSFHSQAGWLAPLS